MKTIITVQHPQSEDQTTDMVASWTEWVLTDTGHARADAIGRALAAQYGKGRFALYSSDLARAHQTAQYIGDHMGMTPVLRTGLRDMHMGSATGKPREWLALHRLPADSEPYSLDYRPLADAESYRELARRVDVVLQEMLALPEDDILVVSHGPTLEMLFHLWAFNSAEQYDYLRFGNVPGGVSVLTADDERNKTIVRLNDTCYDQSAR